MPGFGGVEEPIVKHGLNKSPPPGGGGAISGPKLRNSPPPGGAISGPKLAGTDGAGAGAIGHNPSPSS